MTHLGYQYLGSISGIEVEQGFLDRLEMCWIECQILQQSMFSNRFIQIFENSLRIRAYISSISLRRLSIINRGLKWYSLLQYNQAKKKKEKICNSITSQKKCQFRSINFTRAITCSQDLSRCREKVKSILLSGTSKHENLAILVFNPQPLNFGPKIQGLSIQVNQQFLVAFVENHPENSLSMSPRVLNK